MAGHPLDRSKPLWEMWFVEGLEGGNVAVVTKMHHATIDGVSGANLVAHLLDLEPEPVDDVLPEDDWRPERLPSSVELAARALAGRAARRRRLGRTAATVARALPALAGRRLLGRGGRMATVFTAPPTRFNEAITPHRRIALTAVPLATVKKVKAAFGVTVNDVVLALCGGALRRYRVSHGELPERPLVAAVPVSVRGRDAAGEGDAASANQLSGMTVSLATDEADPVERLRCVSEAARGAKDEHETLGCYLVPELSEFAASRFFGLGARFYSHFRLANVHPPAVNVVVSNIPGPDFPLYFAGAKLLALYPLGPVYDGVGLNLTVLSYLDVVGFGFVAGAELAPDLADLAAAVDESLYELEKEADATPRR